MNKDRPIATEIVRKLQSKGHTALFAGGCVRDMLLKRNPKDFDVATSAHPHEVEKLFPHTVAVGKAFGVIRVRMNHVEIEVATFRSDQAYIDGRHPSGVKFTTAEEDAERRDFTINGLFYDPTSRKVIDYVHGQKDLNKNVIRAIGNPKRRFEEDHLRLIRGIRLAAQLGFRIEKQTFSAIKRIASKIKKVSPERIRDELTKLLQTECPNQGIRLLSRSRLLKFILPEIEIMHGVPQPRAFHPEGDVFIHTCKVLAQLRKPTTTLAWAALLHDVGKPPTFEKAVVRHRKRIRFPEHARVGAEMSHHILRRLKFSNQEREAITAMVANHMTFKDVKQMRTSTLKKLLARPTFEEELQLHQADCNAAHGDTTNVTFLKKKQNEFSKEEVLPPRLISGRDLIKLGLKPGPLFSEILRSVEEEQLEGQIKTYKDALSFVKKKWCR